MKYFVITLFPNIIDSYVNESIIGRAQEAKIIKVKSYHVREFTKDKHGRTDGKVYGGGPGMVLWVDPIINTFEKILKEIEKDNPSSLKLRRTGATTGQGKKETKINLLVVNFVPSAKVFDNNLAKEYSKKYNYIIFICGRYEGVDARVNDVIKDILKNKKSELEEKGVVLNSKIENISIGNFVLTGGELPALSMIDAISRQIKGVLHDNESIEENRIASSEVYARPEIYEKKFTNKKTGKKIVKKYKVPEVLLSGHHAKIEEWRKNKKK